MESIHDTARAFYLAKIVNGGVPERVTEGQLDGLEYFPIELDDIKYWLTAEGLFDPPESDTDPHLG